MLKNVASQVVGVQMITAADGTAFTGSVTVAVTGDGGTQATGSVGSGACTHEGNGYHTYTPAQAETNYDLVAFTFTGTGAIPVTVQIYTRPTTGLLAPTVLGRTLDVTATGAAGIDWANVENQATSVDLSATAINLCDTVTTNTDMRGTDSASTHSAADVWSVATRVLTANTNLNDPTAAAIADAVWDEVISGHLTAGTTGASLNAAGSAGDPWTTTLPGSYTGAQAGKILADILDDTGTTIPGTITTLQGNVTDILTDTGTTLPAQISALSIPSAATIADAVWDQDTLNLTTGVGAFLVALDARTIEILTDTGTTLDGKVNTIDGIVDAILVDTGTTLPAQISALNNVSAAEVNAQCDTAISDYFGTAGSSLTGIPWNAAWDAEVESECTDAINALFTFTAAGFVDANIQKINDVNIVGNGVSPKFGV